MPFMIDYKDELKRLISETYEPADMLSSEFQKTTLEIIEGFEDVIPNNQLDEHLVFEALTELGFTPKENPMLPLVFKWYFKRK